MDTMAYLKSCSERSSCRWLNRIEFSMVGLGGEILKQYDENIPSAVLDETVRLMVRLKQRVSCDELFADSFRALDMLEKIGRYSWWLRTERRSVQHMTEGISELNVRTVYRMAVYRLFWKHKLSAAACQALVEIQLSEETERHIQVMTERTYQFLENSSSVQQFEFQLERKYRTMRFQEVSADFVTNESLWDVRTVDYPMSEWYMLYMIVKCLMIRKSDGLDGSHILTFGVYDARKNEAYSYDLNNIASKLLYDVQRNVIGYRKGDCF